MSFVVHTYTPSSRIDQRRNGGWLLYMFILYVALQDIERGVQYHPVIPMQPPKERQKAAKTCKYGIASKIGTCNSFLSSEWMKVEYYTATAT